MTLFKKTTLATLLIASMGNIAIASESPHEEIDASDLTKANTSAFIGVNNQGDVKASGSLSFTLDNGQMAMTTLEGTMDKDGKYSDSRLQYFHVFNLDSAVTPRIAASVDIIDSNEFTTVAAGGIALFKTPIDSLTLFARGAVLAGEYSDNFMSEVGNSGGDNSIVGGMAAGYAVWKAGADGTYFALYPELTYLGGDVELTSVKTTLMGATPISQDHTKWLQAKIENTYTNVDSGSHKNNTDETAVWFLYKAFF